MKTGVCFFRLPGDADKTPMGTLKAVAVAGHVYHPTSSDFIARHQLGNSATVLRSLHSLLKMELNNREIDSDGNPYYGIHDVLFGRWVGR